MRFYSTLFVNNLAAENDLPFAQGDLYKKYTQKFLKLYELCFNSFVVNSNKECKLIVNDLSYQHIKKYTSITDNFLLKFNYPLNEDYNQTWSLPKLYCYDYLCSKGDPFLFFDLDTILSGEIDEKFLSNEIFAFEKVPVNQIKDWDLISFIRTLHKAKDVDNNKEIFFLLKEINFNLLKLNIPNCAIFGGNNLEKINNYTKLAINHCLDRANQSFWNDKYYKGVRGFEKACILEQFLLGLIFGNQEKNNITLLNEFYLENNIPFVLSHLAGDKWLLGREEIKPETIYNMIYKISKKYKVKYYLDIFYQYHKIDFPELNFTEEEKDLFSFKLYDFFKHHP